MNDRRPCHPRLPEREQSARLTSVIERVKRAQKDHSPLVIFDLDGTLLDNRPRTAAILYELAERWAETRPELAKLLRDARYEALDYLLADNLKLLGVNDEKHHTEALEYWKSRFFFDELLHHDVPVKGAVEFAQGCYDAGATLVYFTGRDLPNMALGTYASLRDNGFPIGVPGTELVLKPRAEMSDEEFKRGVTPLLRRSGVVTAAFDNEPGNCNIFKELFPETDVFLVDTQHFPGAPALDPRVDVIADFGIGP